MRVCECICVYAHTHIQNCTEIHLFALAYITSIKHFIDTQHAHKYIHTYIHRSGAVYVWGLFRDSSGRFGFSGTSS